MSDEDSSLTAITKVWASVVGRFLDLAGIAGLIATIITVTICYITINGQEIPEVLSHALTTILGFYFGAHVTGTTKKARAA